MRDALAIIINKQDLSKSKMSKIKRSFKKAMFRGIEFEEILSKPIDEVVQMFDAKKRRRYARGVSKKKSEAFLKKLRKAKQECEEGEKPKGVKTHMRNFIILPEMVGSIVETYGGKSFNPVEIKPDMIGCYLGEFSMTYKPVSHGKLGVGATRSSKFTATT